MQNEQATSRHIPPSADAGIQTTLDRKKEEHQPEKISIMSKKFDGVHRPQRRSTASHENSLETYDD